MSAHHGRLGGRARQTRNAKILRESDVCYLCGQPGADAVDHIVPLARGGTEDRDNLAPAHHDVPPYCNRRKADHLPSEIDRRVVMVCGAPGAGKTTYARDLAQRDGLTVYDLDDPHWHGSDALLRAELVKVREDTSARAVVIRTGATLTARQKAATMMGATDCIVLDTPLDVCLARIRERDRTTPPVRVQINGARQWWATYEPGEVKLSFANLRRRRSGSLARP